MDKTSAPEKIVGALSTTGYITNDGEIVASWLKNGVIKKFLSKDEMKLMASFDLGENWRKMAENEENSCDCFFGVHHYFLQWNV